jgi:O-antigen ligase
VAAGDRQLIPASIVLVAAWLLVTRTKGTLSTAPLAGPLGYANAKASLFLQAAVAALMLVAAARGWVGRILGLVAALAFVAVPLVIHSYMAAGVALTLPALALVVNGRNRGRLTAWVLSVVLCLALLGTVLAGLSFRRMESSGNALNRVYAFLSERRPALWSDALEEMVEHPAFGVGPGRFPEFSAVSRSDPDDAAWAHNGFLQQGAEQGVIGLALVVLLFVWGLLRLGATPGGDRVTALAAVALAALGVHACMDYIFHFAALPIMAAALAGAGVVAPGRPRT